jgi:SAM-dependent methyltransferase
MDSLQERIGDIWSERYSKKQTGEQRLKWTGSRTILDHVTRLITDEPCSSVQEANIRLIRRISPQLPHARGLSVACGRGSKEMALLEAGVVTHFDCYELSENAVLEGREEAVRRKLDERISFHIDDAFKARIAHKSYDCIYWDNAMHHMLDARAAMRWSRDLLAKDGCFFMYDFVGPTRFQWTDEQVRILKNILESLDDSYFLIPNSEYMWKKEPNRMSVEEMMNADPSEAADSDSILPAFREYFPTGTIIPLGGLVYVLGLDGILVNIPDDSQLLKKMLNIDIMLGRQGHNYFAVAHCTM